MIKQTITAILPIVLLLTACDFQEQYEKRKQNFRQPEKTVQVENTPQKQAKKALPTPPNELQIQSYTHNQQYCFDTKDPNRCSTAKLTRLEISNLPWLTELLNQQIQWDIRPTHSAAGIQKRRNLPNQLVGPKMLTKQLAMGKQIRNPNSWLLSHLLKSHPYKEPILILQGHHIRQCGESHQLHFLSLSLIIKVNHSLNIGDKDVF